MDELLGLYRHFKGNLYRVVSMATHSESGELYVVYVALNDKKTYVRPAEMFFSDVDRSKYPNCAQTKRFERIGD
ncbi:DUF1653 domain-containing protein [Adlercreutzia sp. ZJ141]|uniref:DUF1653 domain-containing protein n=1 Tax=Adlercreutzia sp. ZJ141 TaxID=2709406 RepID=UPI0013EE37AA|nr:DUF1653 domain-containing protein [Adlercreutzia sp. ZJ141]